LHTCDLDAKARDLDTESYMHVAQMLNFKCTLPKYQRVSKYNLDTEVRACGLN